MMSSTSRSLRSEAERSFDSALWFDAESAAGVRFAIARLTFGRRLDLARRIREIGRRAEFLAAGADVRDKLGAAVVGAGVDRAYLEGGLLAVGGVGGRGGGGASVAGG